MSDITRILSQIEQGDPQSVRVVVVGSGHSLEEAS